MVKLLLQYDIKLRTKTASLKAVNGLK